MGAFSGAAPQHSGFNWGRAALALFGGDEALQAIQRREQLQRQNEELRLRQEAAQREVEQQNNQIWGLKASEQFSNPEIAAMNPADRSQAMRELVNPYTLSPGQVRHSRGVSGGPEQIVTAPTMDEQNFAAMNAQQPGMGDAARRRSAYGPPIPTQPGGGVMGYNDTGAPTWLMRPDGVGPSPQQPAAPQQGGSARNNPGGLRYPGSMQFRSFPTEAAGIAAQEAQLRRPQYLGTPHSISQIVERYAPRRSRGGDNTDEQVDNYIARVSRRLGIDPNVPLSVADVPRVAAAMREVETGRRGNVPPTSRSLASAPRQPVQVNSPQEAAALPPGTRFRTPDGREGTRN